MNRERAGGKLHGNAPRTDHRIGPSLAFFCIRESQMKLRRSYFTILAVLAAGACQNGGSGLSSADAGDGTGSGGTSMVSSSGADDDAIVLECEPGQVRCMGQGFLETCAPTGLEWVAEPCPNNTSCVSCEASDETCSAADHCAGPCESDTLVPSSAGCSFIANRQLHYNVDFEDSVIIANPNEELSAHVRFWMTPEGKRKEELVEEFDLPPDADHVFPMNTDFVIGTSTMFRTGGTFRVESDVPVVAYQHSPYASYISNDSSMLLPESALGKSYVVVSYAPHEENVKGKPTYFEVIATEDNTTVRWTPPVPTAGNGLPIDPVAAGGTGEQKMNRFDTMRVVASESASDDFPGDMQDVSGTVIEADKPIWVVGGSRCSRVPVRETPSRGFCDSLQELLIPLEYWGDEYVAHFPPLRRIDGTLETTPPDYLGEQHFWRIYAGGKDGVTLSTDPPVLTAENCPSPNVFVDGSCTLPTRGSWIEVAVGNGQSFYVTGTAPFMPVGYLQSRRATSGGAEPFETSTLWGDPAMYQLVPPAQFLDRYVIRTGVGYPHNFVQVTRAVGGPNVIVAPNVIQPSEWRQVGNSPYEFATVEIPEGAQLVHSSAPIGLVQVGFTEAGDEHFDGCVHPPNPECAPCPENTTQQACEDAEYENNSRCCAWLADEQTCIAARLCNSSYAYPGGMKSEPIYIP